MYFLEILSTETPSGASNRQNQRSEVFPLEEEAAFIRYYRLMIETYRLAPEVSAKQLTDILRLVRETKQKPRGRPPAREGREQRV